MFTLVEVKCYSLNCLIVNIISIYTKEYRVLENFEQYNFNVQFTRLQAVNGHNIELKIYFMHTTIYFNIEGS